MLRLFLTGAALYFLMIPTHAQSNALDKKLERAYEFVKQDKLEKAETYLLDLLEDHPDYGDGWDLLVKISYKRYNDSKLGDKLFSGKVTVTTKDANGKEVKSDNDSLAENVLAMLNEFRPSKLAYSRFLYHCRLATSRCHQADYASMYSRMLLVDVDVDSNVSKKALKYYNEAENEFVEKNFSKAALLYRRALEAQPDFYKAQMYMGDCFYALANYPEAINSFKEAKNRFPNLLEPSKYLTDAYTKADLHEKAIDEAIRSTTIYPDQAMFQKLEDAVYLNRQRLVLAWTARGVLPNVIADTTGGAQLRYTPEKITKPSGPWLAYTAAKEKIAPYCNSKGIITKGNRLAASKYLEVYSWEQMLKNSSDTSLAEARRMQAAGYLDCYVLVTCFHHDFYDQYLHFVSENAERIKKYYHDQIKYQ